MALSRHELIQPRVVVRTASERLLRAIRHAQPETVRGFFTLAGKHMRRKLNDLARRFDEQGASLDVHDSILPEIGSTGAERLPRTNHLAYP